MGLAGGWQGGKTGFSVALDLFHFHWIFSSRNSWNWWSKGDLLGALECDVDDVAASNISKIIPPEKLLFPSRSLFFPPPPPPPPPPPL